MISVIQACEIAIQKTGEPFVGAITDVGEGFVLGMVSKEGDAPDISPIIIRKNNGDAEPYFPPDHFEELEKGKRIKIPEMYKYKS